MAVDKVKFVEYLEESADWQGKRCEDARNSDNGDIIAAAITTSLLVCLRGAAKAKPLTAGDIQAVIDKFMDGAKMDETTDGMGGKRHVRKGA